LELPRWMFCSLRSDALILCTSESVVSRRRWCFMSGDSRQDRPSSRTPHNKNVAFRIQTSGLSTRRDLIVNSKDQLNYALDYRRYLTHPLAPRILVPCGRRLNSYSPGHRGHCRGNQARYWPRSVVIEKGEATDFFLPLLPCSISPYSRFTKFRTRGRDANRVRRIKIHF
jgi:hypothetical protein